MGNGSQWRRYTLASLWAATSAIALCLPLLAETSVAPAATSTDTCAASQVAADKMDLDPSHPEVCSNSVPPAPLPANIPTPNTERPAAPLPAHVAAPTLEVPEVPPPATAAEGAIANPTLPVEGSAAEQTSLSPTSCPVAQPAETATIEPAANNDPSLEQTSPADQTGKIPVLPAMLKAPVTIAVPDPKPLQTMPPATQTDSESAASPPSARRDRALPDLTTPPRPTSSAAATDLSPSSADAPDLAVNNEIQTIHCNTTVESPVSPYTPSLPVPPPTTSTPNEDTRNNALNNAERALQEFRSF